MVVFHDSNSKHLYTFCELHVITKTKYQGYKSEQNKVIRWRNTSFSSLLLGLPPSATYVGYFQYFMFRKAYFIRVVRIRFVRVYGFCLVRIFCGSSNITTTYLRFCAHRLDSSWRPSRWMASLHPKPWLGHISVGSTGSTSRVPGYRWWGLKAIQLSRRVHLRSMLPWLCGLWSVIVIRAHRAAVPHWHSLFLVQCKGVDVSSMARLRRWSKI